MLLSTDITSMLDCVSLHAAIRSYGEGDIPSKPHSLLVGGESDVIILAEIGRLCCQDETSNFSSEGCLS